MEVHEVEHGIDETVARLLIILVQLLQLPDSAREVHGVTQLAAEQQAFLGPPDVAPADLADQTLVVQPNGHATGLDPALVAGLVPQVGLMDARLVVAGVVVEGLGTGIQTQDPGVLELHEGARVLAGLGVEPDARAHVLHPVVVDVGIEASPVDFHPVAGLAADGHVHGTHVGGVGGKGRKHHDHQEHALEPLQNDLLFV